MPVTVVYAKPHRQYVLTLQVPHNCTVLAAIQRSGILVQCPEIDANWPVGVFGSVTKQPQSTLLQPHDRVEIYRPLTQDPKERRRQKAKAKARALRLAKQQAQPKV